MAAPWEETEQRTSLAPWEETPAAAPVTAPVDVPTPPPVILGEDQDKIAGPMHPPGALGGLFRPWGPWDTKEDFMGWLKAGAPIAGRDIQAGMLQGGLSMLRGPGRAVEAIEKATGIRSGSGLHGLTFNVLKGIADVSKDLEDTLVEPLSEDAGLSQKIQRGVGSAIPYLAGGVAGKAVEAPAWLIPTVMGASQGGTAQYEEAVASGADPGQALIAQAAGSAVGASEGIPMAFFLGKLNKLTGGKTVEALKKLFEETKGNIPLEALKGAVIEGAQEGFQTLGDNFIASDLAAYDPNRTLSENLVENITTGGVVGSFLGGGFGTVRKAENRKARRELEKLRAELLATGDPINMLDGAVTPVQTYVALKEAAAKAEAELARRGEEAEQRQLREGPLAVPPDVIPLHRQQPDYLGNNTYDKSMKDLPVDPEVEKTLPKRADGSPISVNDALKLQPVVATNVNPYSKLAEQQDKNIRQLQKRIEAKKKFPGKSEELPEELSVMERQLEALMAARQATRVKTEIARRLIKHVKDYAAAFREVYTPDSKLVISDGTGLPENYLQGILGFFTMAENVEIEPGKLSRVNAVYLKMDDMVTEIYNTGGKHATPNLQAEKRMLFEVLNHELGHSVAVNSVATWIDQASAGDAKAARMLALVREEYGRWLQLAAYDRDIQLEKYGAEYGQAKQTSLEGDEWAISTSPKKRAYDLSFDEFFADMTARLSTQGALADPVMTQYFQPVLKQYQEIFKAMPEWAQNQYGGDWKLFLESLTLGHKVGKELEDVLAGGDKDLIDAVKGKLPGFNPENFAGHEEWKDRWNRFMSYTLNLEQMVKENPHISQWKEYKDAIEAMETYRRRFAFEVDSTIKAWRSLGKVEAQKVTEILYEEALDKEPKTPSELSERLTAEGLAVYQQIRGNLTMALEEMRAVALADAQKSFTDNTEMLAAEMKSINEDFDKLAEQGYFPFIRFGKWTVTARAKQDLFYNGTNYKKGQLISFPTFESKEERDLATSVIKKELGDKAAVAPSIMRESEFQIQGLPRSMLRALKKKLESTGDLTSEMRESFDTALAESTPFRNFRKHFLKKKGIHGYSLDGMRSFAEYMGRAAGHIARVKHADDIRGAMDRMQQSVELIKMVGGDSTKRQMMQHWMQRHYNYVMNPENEWAPLRGLGFQLMLGYNIKSALINAMQIPSVTYPYLAARYSDSAAIGSLSKATWTLKDWIANKNAFIDALPDEQGNVKKANPKKARIASLLAQGQNEDWLDQSLATELAIARSERNLNRGLHLPTGKRIWHEFSRIGAMPFHLIEKMNRYITAIATYELAYEESGNHNQAVQKAKEAVRSTQYEHARWNRPEFMRGKKSLALLFANYLQNTVYFATRDKGALRYWLVLLALAGMQGLPFAEDISDLADFAGTYFKRTLGMKNPKVDVRREARELLEELHANPDLVLHGLSQDSFGLGKIGELTGTPIPRFDLSGSVGMGNILPLTEIPKAALQRDPNDTLAQALFSAGGAGGSVLEDYYRGVMSNDPDDWKRAEALLPTAPRNFSKAVRLFMRGAEKTRAGDVVAEFDPSDTRDRLELAGLALGFTPSRLRTGWEREIAIKDMIAYYKLQQTELLQQHNWAVFNEDREAVADVMEAIREYNDSVPMEEMVITGKTMKDSLKAYFDKRFTAEAGVAAEKKYRRLREKIEEAYPDPYGDTLDTASGDHL